MWSGGSAALAMSAVLCALVLAGIGLLTSLFNGRSPSYSALRQVVFGCTAAAVTFGVGRLLGVSLS
jgi:VIT1/CCC1 family predicted Fe2+/Mn2+ transporter